MKKVLSLFALLLILPAFVFAESSDIYYINEKGVEMSHEEYDNLVNLGFIDLDIKYMDQETFDFNKDQEGGVIATSERYFKTVGNPIVGYETVEVTEEEYNSGQSTELSHGTPIAPLESGYIDTTYKKLSTGISKSGNSYKFANVLQWKTIPTTRSYDIIGIGTTTENIKINDQISFTQYISYSNGTDKAESICIQKRSSSGGGAIFKLPSESNVSSLVESMYYYVSKDATGTIDTKLHAVGDYRHAGYNVNETTVKNNTTINFAGINLGSAISGKYDYMGKVDVYKDVTW